jgi:hypothetical protein
VITNFIRIREITQEKTFIQESAVKPEVYRSIFPSGDDEAKLREIRPALETEHYPIDAGFFWKDRVRCQKNRFISIPGAKPASDAMPLSPETVSGKSLFRM